MLLFLELTNKGEAITISTSIKLPVGIENFEEIRTGGYYLIIPGLSEPPVRTLRATIPENESHIFR